MSDPKQLPHLLNLLDDESDFVRTQVIKALSEFGASLEEEVEKLDQPLTVEQRKLLQSVFEVHTRQVLKDQWASWYKVDGDKEKLEAALTLLSNFQSKFKSQKTLSEQLDEWANAYNQAYEAPDALDLAEFLFHVKELKGAENDYYNPFNSNLLYVLQQKRGIPISLACVYILLAHRLHLSVEGCNLPGHFLARVTCQQGTFFIDGFNGGRVLNEKMILQMKKGEPDVIKTILDTPADARTIVRRFLTNLNYAYEQAEQLENSRLMAELLNHLENSTIDGLI